MTLISKIADKISGNSAPEKNVDSSTTVAPGHGQSSTLGGQSSTAPSTTGSSYGTDSSSQYGADGQRKKGLGEKAKEAVGLDPKDGRDPKDMGYNQGSSTAFSGGNQSSTGYNQSGTSSGLGSSSTGTTGSSSNAYGTDSSSQYGADGQRKKGLGEKAKEAVGLDPKDGRDPKDIGYNQSSSTSGYSGSQGNYGTESRGIDRQSERMGDLSISNSERAQQHTAAPVVQERVHDQYENIDKTRVEELHDRTKVQQTVQPVYDERTEGTQRSVQDHGVEVHEHGHSGLDSRTEAELAAKRQQLAGEHRSTHDERTTERSLRPDVDVQSRTNRIEEVVPVVERDVYRPHEIEHNKRVVEVHHEAPELSGTRTNKPISVSEWESKSGSSLRTTDSSTRTRRGSSSSSSDEEVEVDGVKTRRKKGLGEKIKEKIGLDPKDGRDPKDAGYTGSSTSSSTGYNQSGTTGTSSGLGSSTGSSQHGAEGQRHKGLGEKAKETVGLDPKDGRDPKDIGYNQSGSTTGNNQSGTSSTGYNQSGTSRSSIGQSSQGYSGQQQQYSGSSTGTTGTSGYGQQGVGSTGNSYGTDSTQYGADGQRHKGLGEKAKETVGLDPKDGRDPKDIGYNQSGSTTGYNQSGTSSSTGTTGYNQAGTSGATGYGGTTTSVADDTETHRKKGFTEKIKEKFGLDPKDGKDPKDAGYTGSSTGSRGL